MFQNKMKISPPVYPVSLVENIKFLKNRCFIYNTKGSIEQWEMDCAKKRLIERSNYYKSEGSSWFYKASCRLYIHCTRYSFNPFTVSIYYHKSCYVKCTIKPIGISRKNHSGKEDENKYCLEEAIKMLLNVKYTHISNKKGFLLHDMLEYLKEFCNYFGIEPILSHTVSLK